MPQFEFPIQQTVTTFYNGSITVEAKNESEALQILRDMSYEEVNEKVESWEMNLDADSTEPIEIFNNTMGQIMIKTKISEDEL